MTYDSWKTTDPREYEPEPEEGLSELDFVYEQLWQAKNDAKHAAEVAASRIKALETALVRLGQMIDEALYGIRF
jgi:hypothetical protein